MRRIGVALFLKGGGSLGRDRGDGAGGRTPAVGRVGNHVWHERRGRDRAASARAAGGGADSRREGGASGAPRQAMPRPDAGRRRGESAMGGERGHGVRGACAGESRACRVLAKVRSRAFQSRRVSSAARRVLAALRAASGGDDADRATRQNLRQHRRVIDMLMPPTNSLHPRLTPLAQPGSPHWSARDARRGGGRRRRGVGGARRYASLGKNGKPQPGEYTLLAGFAVTDGDGPPRVVAIGTGTKCLPAESRCPRGEPWRTPTPKSSRDAPSFASRTTSSIASSRPTDPRDPTPAHLRARPARGCLGRERHPTPRALPPSTGDPAAPLLLPVSVRGRLNLPGIPARPRRRRPRRRRPRRRPSPGAPASKRAKTSGAGGGGGGHRRSSSARTEPTPTPSSASSLGPSARLDSNPDEAAHVVHELQR